MHNASPVSEVDADLKSGTSFRSEIITYTVGNGAALLIGLTVAYLTLTLSGTVSPRLLDVRTVDFMEYFSVARMIFEGHGGSMYSWVPLSHMQSHLAGQPASAFGVLAFFYPPYFALFLVPLTSLPYGVAYLVWFVIDCFVLAAVLFALERYSGLSGRQALAFRAVSLCFLPVFLALGLGQVSIVLLALVSVCFVALRQRQYEVAGAALAVASMKPVYVAPLVLVLLLRRQWRAVVAFCLSCALLLACAVPVLGISIYGSYVRLLREDASWQGRSIHDALWFNHVPVANSTYAPEWNHGFAGFAELLLHGGAATALYAALSLCALVLLTACSLRSATLDVPIAMAVIVGLLVSPHTLIYDYALLLLPVAIALRHRHWGYGRLGSILAVGFILVTVGYRFAFFVPLQLSVVAAAGLLIWLTGLVSTPVEAAVPDLGDRGHLNVDESNEDLARLNA